MVHKQLSTFASTNSAKKCSRYDDATAAHTVSLILSNFLTTAEAIYNIEHFELYDKYCCCSP
jgi:hypothetical protein